MTLENVRNFLDHEYTDFLQPALDRATQNKEVACDPNPKDTVCEMWQGWVKYYDELITKNRTMRNDWGESDFQNNLAQEIVAIGTLQSIIFSWITGPELDGQAKPCVMNLRQLLEIERQATESMLDQVL